MFMLYIQYGIFFQNTMFLSYQKQLEIARLWIQNCCFYILTANCEFHCLILFISEMKEAFFNKTTENVCVYSFLKGIVGLTYLYYISVIYSIIWKCQIPKISQNGNSLIGIWAVVARGGGRDVCCLSEVLITFRKFSLQVFW